MKYFFSSLIIIYMMSGNLNAQSLKLANSERLESRILALASIGVNEDGGLNRHAYSEADIQARILVIEMMKKAGLKVSIDAAGNILGRREGKIVGLPVICFGSHIDTVPSGGKFDGTAGVLTALECIELMNANNIITNHPLEVIVFTDEEGGLIGSKSMIGTITKHDLERTSNSGKIIKQGIKDLGGVPDQIKNAIRDPKTIKAFIELHIEQGAFLDNEKIQIGVVEGIVGIEEWQVEITGKANHAGTTPMNIRQDALLAASKLVIVVNEIVKSFEGQQVGTVGELRLEPGASNVVPGFVKMSIELRDLSRKKTYAIFEKIEARIPAIEKETGTKISYKHEHTNIPAILDEDIKGFLAKSAEELGLSYKFMPSGAGHDAQNMAKITPTGMIFIPSKDGISHSPKEFSTIEDITNGANVLFKTILAIDKK